VVLQECLVNITKSLDFSIYLILPATLWFGSIQPLTETSTRNVPGGKRQPEHEVDFSQPSGPPWPLVGQLYLCLLFLIEWSVGIHFISGEDIFIVFHIICVVVIHVPFGSFVTVKHLLSSLTLLTPCSAKVKKCGSLPPLSHMS
jgi:hypothetical protein